jgi:hypothetical protein
MATAKKSLSALELVARDLADAEAHIDEALALVEGRVSAEITTTLIRVSNEISNRLEQVA